VPEGQSESQEEILAAYEASLTAEDIPPEDEAYSFPDPDTGPPVELLELTDQELDELLEATPAQPAPSAWPLSCRADFLTAPGPGSVPGQSRSAGWPLNYPDGAGAGSPNGFLAGEGSGRGFAEGGVLDELPASIVLAEFADDAFQRVEALDDNSLIGVLRAWRRLASWASARELAMVAELARRRPAPGTPPADGPGRFPVQISEFAADEVGLALTLTRVGSRAEFDLALDLAERPAIAAALETGRIDLAKARILVSMICPLERAHADAVESKVLPRAGELTTGELRAALLRAILAVDPDAARRRRETAQKEARVEYWADPEGTATLAGRSLPPAEVLAADRRLCAIAKAWKKQGAQGGMDLLRAHAYLALLLGQPIDTPPPSLLPPVEPGNEGSGSTGQRGTSSPSGEDSPTTRQPGLAGLGRQGPAAPIQPDTPAGTQFPTADQPGPAAPNHRHPSAPGQPANPAAARFVPGERDSKASAVANLDRPAPVGLLPTAGVPLPPMTGEVNLTVPLATLLGLADAPGEAGGYGPVHADVARLLADAMATHRSTRWGVIVTSQDGRAMGYGGGIRARPVSAGGWKITLTTEPIAPYP